jgi:hypothetical protein
VIYGPGMARSAARWRSSLTSAMRPTSSADPIDTLRPGFMRSPVEMIAS